MKLADLIKDLVCIYLFLNEHMISDDICVISLYTGLRVDRTTQKLTYPLDGTVRYTYMHTNIQAHTQTTCVIIYIYIHTYV